jgi:SlyX protein
MTPDERIDDLEIRLAHQDGTIAALDEVLREFALRVERLERSLEDLRAASAEAGGAETGPADEKPPHY